LSLNNRKRKYENMSNKIDNYELIKNAFLDLITLGESISTICQRPDMPGRSTLYRWLRRDKKFLSEYRNATIVRSRELLAEALDIADRAKANAWEVAADRLRIATRMKLAASLAPRRGPAPRKKLQEKVTIHVIDHGSDLHRETMPDDPTLPENRAKNGEYHTHENP
jgi:hypothetical protein